ncbi:bone marrow stromal antigen 2 [Phacochoerus africanus]|uniref:bone marrow stromal antigen 2 n=1 Tax=Phacochoerus africanus TaxID=41426 RepID=UPI001FD9FBE9|nr:bone marrow stromal antigen 2 [Phacochoerus africanus]
MSPSLYSYSPLPMVSCLRESKLRDSRPLLWLVFLLCLLVVGQLVSLIIFAVKANSKGCKDGLRAQQECQNHTDHLQHQLTVAQEVLQRTKAQYTVCNQTVENLRDSLEMEKTQSQKQLKELQGEIKRLNQKLQQASEEAERLRKAFGKTTVNSGSFSCSSSSSLLFIAVVVLGLNALLT